MAQLPKKRAGEGKGEEAALPTQREGDALGAQGASVPTATPPCHPGASSEKQTPEKPRKINFLLLHQNTFRKQQRERGWGEKQCYFILGLVY